MRQAARFFPSVILPLTLLFTGVVTAQTKQPQRQDNPTVKETLRWMQTTLESGAGDISVWHETRSTRLEDFVGCKVHFSYSTHQVPYMNGEPAPEPNKTYHVDYFFSLGDIDPTNMTFSKGSGIRADDKGLYETPSFLTISTRNDEKKITIRLPWQSEADSKPDDTSLILTLDSIDQDYVARFAEAFKHAVEACGGKPSLFADSHGQSSDEHAPLATGRVPARSTQFRKDTPAIAKAADGAIVTIVMSNNDKPFALGTGFLVSANGVIVTNYHVIENGNVAVVKFPDGTSFPVDGVLASDKVRDLAVIKIHGKTFRTLTLGNSDRVQVGEDVVAIGNPLGFELGLELTVSNGNLSAVRQDKEARGKLLQVTAPITHGSSGGPLFNMMGEVIGIMTLGFPGAGNLNFAIPINDAKLLLSHQSAKLQNLPNEPEEAEAKPAAPPVAKVDPPDEKIWTADLLGGEFRIKAEKTEIRITTIRPPIKAICVAYHISQDNFTHDIILDVKDGDNLVGLLDANLEFIQDGKPMVAKGLPLGLRAVSDSQLIGFLVTGYDDKIGDLKWISITFTSK
ncbi:MAG TPA: trypsin-like peptidase domain-containing protein [Candidatus Acidoferrum sp.]|nr:trypsin-like peptidase domain-containing protein [Candidatus Acidoferrum sp.]